MHRKALQEIKVFTVFKRFWTLLDDCFVEKLTSRRTETNSFLRVHSAGFVLHSLFRAASDVTVVCLFRGLRDRSPKRKPWGQRLSAVSCPL